MLDYVSPLDDRYIKLGRAAELIAQERQCTSWMDVMDLFKRALFSGEFDSTRMYEEERISGSGWLQIEVICPPPEITEENVALETRPMRHFEMNRHSITSVLFCDGALPGDQDTIDRLFYCEKNCEAVYQHLVSVNFSRYSEFGRQRIADIYIPKAKLRGWLRENNAPGHQFLNSAPLREPEKLPKPPKPSFKLYQFPKDAKGAAGPTAGSDGGERVRASSSRKALPPSRGRPELPGWRRVVRAARAIKAADPDKLNKVVAHEARKIALKEFREIDVPSEQTIVRRMKEILDRV